MLQYVQILFYSFSASSKLNLQLIFPFHSFITITTTTTTAITIKMLSALAARRVKLQGVMSASPSEPHPTQLVHSSKRPLQQQDIHHPTSLPNSNKRLRISALNASQPQISSPNFSRKFRNENETLEDSSHRAVHDSSTDEDIHELIVSNVQQIEPTPVNVAAKKRAWSPSAPLQELDADAEEDPLDNGDVDSLREQFTSKTLSPGTHPIGQLTTFQPVVDQNTFHLSADVVADLDVPSTSYERATLLSMCPGDMLALLGTYNLIVLKGSVTLCGTTLSASPQRHQIFAPRSSPIPVIECDLSSTSGWIKSANIRQHPLNSCSGHGAAILLQELKTGVEGLQRICRTFDGVFASSEWHDGSHTDALNLRGVQIVLFCSFYPQCSSS